MGWDGIDRMDGMGMGIDTLPYNRYGGKPYVSYIYPVGTRTRKFQKIVIIVPIGITRQNGMNSMIQNST